MLQKLYIIKQRINNYILSFKYQHRIIKLLPERSILCYSREIKVKGTIVIPFRYMASAVYVNDYILLYVRPYVAVQSLNHKLRSAQKIYKVYVLHFFFMFSSKLLL